MRLSIPTRTSLLHFARVLAEGGEVYESPRHAIPLTRTTEIELQLDGKDATLPLNAWIALAQEEHLAELQEKHGAPRIVPPRERTAMKSPDHLKAWARASGRAYLVIDTAQMIDALSWPLGVHGLMSILSAYSNQRAREVIDDGPCPKCHGESEAAGCSACHGAGRVTRTKTDQLEPDEMKAAVTYLIDHVRATEPDWSP